MKLIQVNAWQGRLGDSLAAFIEKEEPDIICMQEVYLPNTEVIPGLANQYNFLEEVRRSSGLEHEFFAKSWSFALGTTTVEAGNVILSRYRISDHQEFHPFNHYHTANNREDALPNAQAWQGCTLHLPDSRKLSLANYHGYLEDLPGVFGMGTERTVETMRKVSQRLSTMSRPLIFAGDLNIWPESPAFREFDKLDLTNLGVKFGTGGTLSSAHRATNPSASRSTPDHILVSSEIKVKSFRVADQLVSDHKALVLDFEI